MQALGQSLSYFYSAHHRLWPFYSSLHKKIKCFRNTNLTLTSYYGCCCYHLLDKEMETQVVTLFEQGHPSLPGRGMMAWSWCAGGFLMPILHGYKMTTQSMRPWGTVPTKSPHATCPSGKGCDREGRLDCAELLPSPANAQGGEKPSLFLHKSVSAQHPPLANQGSKPSSWLLDI